MEMHWFGDAVPVEIEREARGAVLEDGRARGIVTDGEAFEVRTAQRVFAGERLVAVVVPVLDVAEADCPVIEIEEV